MNAKLEQVAVALEKRGFTVECFDTPAAAAEKVMAAVRAVSIVGMGGSETMREIGVTETLAAEGRVPVRNQACDLFLLSANALLADGRIVNIDGNGNRVAASISGPKEVIYVIGRNKIVEGGLDDAVARIKRESCPPNCRRLDRKTPCAVTGKCADCDSLDRICKVMVVFDRVPTHTPTRVFLVDADLGY